MNPVLVVGLGFQIDLIIVVLGQTACLFARDCASFSDANISSAVLSQVVFGRRELLACALAISFLKRAASLADVRRAVCLEVTFLTQVHFGLLNMRYAMLLMQSMSIYYSCKTSTSIIEIETFFSSSFQCQTLVQFIW